MADIKSVSKPVRETTWVDSVAETTKIEGARGSASVSEAPRRVAVGKSDVPLRQRALPNIGSLETVIGADERERIRDTHNVPWRMICALRMSAPNGGAAVGTGWFAGPKTIVTAGHCVYDGSFFGGWAASVEVSPGRDADERPFGKVTATRFSALDRWVSHADPDFDIGCIHLDEPLGEETGSFSVAAMPAEDLVNHYVNLSGYPGDIAQGDKQFFHVNRVLHVSPRRVFYDVDTAGGQSGSPVWIQSSREAHPTVIGIHAYGTGGTPFNLGITANSAPRMIPEVLEIIREWVGEQETDEAKAPQS